MSLHDLLAALAPLDTCQHQGLLAVRLGRAPAAASSGASPALPPIAPLATAIAAGAALVTEVAGGRVGSLTVENCGSTLLFGMLGELVLGGRQDRALNSDVLIEPGATSVVTVSCVEAHRWSPPSGGVSFSAGHSTASSRVRSTMHSTVVSSLQATGRRDTDQGAVWRSVDASLRGAGVEHRVSTGTLAGGMKAAGPRLEAYVQACATPVPGRQRGVALFTPGARRAGIYGLRSIDGFLTDALLGHYLHRLVRGAAMDVGPEEATSGVIRAPGEVTEEVLRHLAQSRPILAQCAAGGALGAKEELYQLGGLVASLLTYQGHPIHLSVTVMDEDDLADSPRPVHHAVEPRSAPWRGHVILGGAARGVGPGSVHSPGFVASVVASGASLGHDGREAATLQVGAGPGHLAGPAEGGPRTSDVPGAVLRLQVAGEPPRVLELYCGRYVLGRSSACDLSLQSSTLSRRHAILEVSPEGLTIRDQQSSNGTLVNDEPVIFARLTPGDRVQLGPDVTLVHVG